MSSSALSLNTSRETLTPLTEIDAFEGVKGAISAATIDPTSRIKAAIVGLPKSGKSWFASTAPPPIMYYDFDDRAISLSGKPNIMVKTLIDKNQRSPTAMKSLEADISNFNYRKAKGLSIPTTFVLDTVTYLKKAIENEIFHQDSKLARQIKVGSGPTDYIMVGKSFDVVSGVQAYIQYLITEFSSLGNLIVVYHEKEEKDKEKSTPEKTAYTGKVTVDPQYLANSLTLFNEVFRIEAAGQAGNAPPKYTVTCKTSFDFNSSTTLLIDAIEPPDFQHMLKKHRENLLKQKGAR